MTRFLLIRHGDNDFIGHAFAGRLPGVHLNERGREQAERLAERLAHEPIQRIFSSPLERALETAAPLARRLKVEVQQAEPLLEIDVGAWTGCKIADLASDPRWRLFNTFRGGTAAPGGELMLETQTRVVVFLQRLCDQYPGETIALVSHADVIRAALLYYLGMPLDLFQRLEISPASVSTLDVQPWGPRIVCLNCSRP